MRVISIWTILLGLPLFMGCGDAPDSSGPPPIPHAKALPTRETDVPTTKPATQPFEKDFGSVKFKAPAGWIDKPPANTMIQAEIELPGSGGPARLTISSAGGGLASNLERWKGQFVRRPDDPDPRQTTIQVDGETITILELQGTFADSVGTSGQPRDEWGMFGAAIPLEDRHCFVKCTGPRATLAEQREALLQFLQSTRFRRPA